MEKITAVVVTYNRLELLKRVIDSLRNQTRKLDNIIVINNDSPDGTKDWLDSQVDLDVIHQANVGGSGGFYRGIEYAYQKGFDKIWCMDDDVFPKADCLESLLKYDGEDVGIMVPLRYMNNQPFYGEVERLNLSNPFKPMRKVVDDSSFKDGVVSIEQMAFEGPLINRRVVEKIGLPNKELFILFDDTDYSYRTTLVGMKVLLIKTANLDKYDFKTNFAKKEKFVRDKWKIFYDLRNTTYFDHVYGKNVFYRYIGNIWNYLGVTAHFFVHYIFGKNYYQWKDLSLIFKTYLWGVKHHLGKISI